MTAGWWWCCCQGCVYVTQTFVGVDDDPLPDGWTTQIGAARIDQNCAELDPNTVVTYDDFVPLNNYAVVTVRFDVARVAAGQEYRAIAGWKDDKYYYAFVRINSLSVPPKFTYGIGKGGEGGSELISVDDYVSTTAASITLCFGKTLMMALMRTKA